MTGTPDATRPLAGVRIIEISSFVAVPLAGMTLGQLGAEVIRVDPISGAGLPRVAGHRRRRLYWAGGTRASLWRQTSARRTAKTWCSG
jgi:2-methylfumaryl-CoA isomerase